MDGGEVVRGSGRIKDRSGRNVNCCKIWKNSYCVLERSRPSRVKLKTLKGRYIFEKLRRKELCFFKKALLYLLYGMSMDLCLQPRPWTQVIGGHAHKTYHLWCNDYCHWQPVESACGALLPPLRGSHIAAKWPEWEVCKFFLLLFCVFHVRFWIQLGAYSDVLLAFHLIKID
jgi:hypothetical protein